MASRVKFAHPIVFLATAVRVLVVEKAYSTKMAKNLSNEFSVIAMVFE